MKAIACSQILDRTAEGMCAYQASKRILAARDPARWGVKCGGGHEDMRTSFVWMYLVLKYGEDDSRKTVTGRIHRLSKAPPMFPPTGLHIATSRDSSSQLDPGLILHLGLPQEVAGGRNPSFIPSVCNVGYLVCPSAGGSAFELVLDSQEPGCPTLCLPGPSPPTPPSILSLFRASIDGSPFAGGVIDIFAPWLFNCDCDFRLIDKRTGRVLSAARTKISCYGPRYQRVTRCKVPPKLVEGVSMVALRDTMVEQSLSLNLNSSFLLYAVNTSFATWSSFVVPVHPSCRSLSAGPVTVRRPS
ncbi:hypothetical protein DFP72DRAFT_1072160 [Ephemerocybe angulata]|uniref:Uncharacterized protein n=1 Tax=Ephemerocybe angulata TaxID=980116 RepID=A0A8H6HPB8_9AGAR|nr:hypothetical protein DFP72DRAFT_1072160 [Tulosesus angulatus]